MSSRGQLVGSAPESGIYIPRPTPSESGDMPVYINDELLSLGGRLNNVLEGGAFPPQSEMPKRFKEGMVIFFTQEIEDSPITSSGVWLYKNKKWWKMVDDPSAIRQNLLVYQTVHREDPVPIKPPKDKFREPDLGGWSYLPTNSTSPFLIQYGSMAIGAYMGDPPDVDWSDPIPYGNNGSEGYSIEFRYIADTDQPAVADPIARYPKTPDGEEYTITIPPVQHPDKNFVWSIYASVNTLGLKGPWSEPSKFSTPDTTKVTIAYATTMDEVYPSFDPNATGLPGPDWKHQYPNVPSGYYLWRTERLEWTDGSPQTQWATPFQMNDVAGITIESRFLASTVQPSIKDPHTRFPYSTNEEPFTINIPPVSHPNRNSIWVTTGQYDRFQEMVVDWSDPVKMATPDTTFAVKAYAVGRKDWYPTFTPTGTPLPGPEWSKDYPDTSKFVRGDYVWNTERLEWSNGEAQTIWTTPYRSAAVDAIDSETRFIASTNKPPITVTERDPAGWTTNIPPVSHPDRDFVWASTCTYDSVNNDLLTNWTDPVKYATPDTTVASKAFAKGTRDTYPSFNPALDDLPGSAWSRTPPASLNKGQYVWNTERLEWSNGDKQTNWTTPYRSTAVDSISVENRYSASTSKPAIDSDNRNPPGWTVGIPAIVHPNKNFIWISTCTFDAANEELVTNWSDPVKYSTPDSTEAVSAFAITKDGGYPAFNPTAPGLPGDSWSETQPNVPVGYRLWKTERLEWTNGDKQTDWSTPIQVNYIEGVTTETRYVASTNKPTIKDKNSENVQTTGGELYTVDLPNVSHPSKNFVWATTGQFNRFKEMTIPWSDPVKYSTPDTTQAARAFAVGDKGSYPSFNAGASGLPGSGWTTTVPSLPANKFLWYTERLEWTNGDKQTNWSAPVRLTGEDGNQGIDGVPGSGHYTITNDSAANSWPTNATTLFVNHVGRNPVLDDGLTFVNTTKTKQQSRRWTGSAWGTYTQVVDGNWLINGSLTGNKIVGGTITGDKIQGNTISGDKITAGTSIQAPVIKGGFMEAISFRGTNVLGTGTITGGTITGTQFNNGDGTFVVSSSGALTARSANITGAINATSLNAQNVSGINLTSSGTITGGLIRGTRMEVGSNFSVSSTGVLTAKGANITGAITATSGSFTGTVNATNGTFTGTVTGSTISGGQMNINNNFIVNNSGVLTAKGANIAGHIVANSGSFTGTVNATNGTFTGTVTGSTISGGQMNIANKFIVDTAGRLTAREANIVGHINATTLAVQAATTINLSASGTIAGGVINGSHIRGGDLRVPAVGDAKFVVDSKGNMTCNDATIHGDLNGNFNGTATGHIRAQSLTLLGSIPPEINNSNVTPGSIGAATTGQVNAAQNAANNAQNTANGAQGGVNGINDKLYVNQSKIQIKSSNYLSGSRGWAIDQNGNAEFNNGTIRGSLVAGDITAASINAGRITGDLTTGRAQHFSGTHSGTGWHNAAVFRVHGSSSGKARTLYFGGTSIRVKSCSYQSGATECYWRVLISGVVVDEGIVMVANNQTGGGYIQEAQIPPSAYGIGTSGSAIEFQVRVTNSGHSGNGSVTWGSYMVAQCIINGGEFY